MSARAAEIERWLSVLDAPWRERIRTELDEYEQGNMEPKASRELLKARPGFRSKWLAFLSASEAAELRWAGALEIGLPERGTIQGTFDVTVWPSGAKASAKLALARDPAALLVRAGEGARTEADVWRAAGTIARELAARFGRRVHVIEA